MKTQRLLQLVENKRKKKRETECALHPGRLETHSILQCL